MDSTSRDGENQVRFFIEVETGELFEAVKSENKKEWPETLAITASPTRKIVHGGTKYRAGARKFSLFYNEGADMLMPMLDYKGRVFMAMCKAMSYGNKLHATNAGLADMAGIRRNHVSKAVSDLIAMGAIERCEPDQMLAGTPAYRVNGEYLFRGSEDVRKKTMYIQERKMARESVARSVQAA